METSKTERIVFVGPGSTLPEAVRRALSADGTEVRELSDTDHALSQALSGRDVVVLDGETYPGGLSGLMARLADGRTTSVPVVVSGAIDPGFQSSGDACVVVVRRDALRVDLPVVLPLAETISDLRRSLEHQQSERQRHQRIYQELKDVGQAFSRHKRLDDLLADVLTRCRKMALADAGCIYMLEEDRENRRQFLRFKVVQNDTIPVNFKNVSLPLDHNSVAGHVALSGESIRVDDVYQLPAGSPFSFDPQWDKQSGYGSHSMQAVPMQNHKGDVVGVIQLINRKSAEAGKFMAFQGADFEITHVLASMAAVAVENLRLVSSMTELFEGFVTASANAVEVLDSATGGHCERLAQYACHTAAAINELTDGPLTRYKFSRDNLKELRFAGLLHDIGKIGVRESVLKKDRRLTEDRLEIIKIRFEYFKEVLKHKAFRQAMNSIFSGGAGGSQVSMASVERDLAADVARLDGVIRFILEINAYGRLDDPEYDRLKEVASMELVDSEGHKHAYLTPDEFENLAIRRGNLTPSERKEIEYHINLTYNILASIPWLPEYRHVPDIAGGHHERMDGSGYPNALKGEEIHVGAQILAMVDVYEALTASDRPYKPPVPVEKALKILEAEAKANHLNPDIVALFIEKKVYQKVQLPKPVERKAGSTKEAW